nr:MAG TPA: hypothetical protein [Caudoviricetes sp.]
MLIDMLIARASFFYFGFRKFGRIASRKQLFKTFSNFIYL